MKPRVYTWTTEEPLDGSEVRITAEVSGRDSYPTGNNMDPPDYREVVLFVEMPFRGEGGGVGYIDITEPDDLNLADTEMIEQWMDMLRDEACMLDDDAAAAAYDAAHEYNPED